ncbi:cytokinin dehydrogenase 6-like [Typha latifolia]|uniref:cytokinin dehydrogenase 6-like n=1 Tax=Typha latifolia TaxID=4733 RepID=UPI003C300215
MAYPLLRTKSFSSFLIVVFLIASFGQLKSWPDALPQDLLTLDIAVKIFADSNATTLASTDFGNLKQARPAAALYPSSPDDIAALVRFSYSSSRPFPISPRGHGHSIWGQAFAPEGIVVEMAALGHGGAGRINVTPAYVDAGGEQLWIDVLHATLEHGLAPRSWTDYLYLTVGGTLSNAGISGQVFRHGPQIANVYELDVITGKGEAMTCSKNSNSDLFHAVLGGLGQFGIITRARIALQPAPKMARWVRLMYTDVGLFTRDQERVISRDPDKVFTLNYLEGSLLVDNSLIGSWRSSSFFSRADIDRISGLAARSGIRALYCLEGAVYYDQATKADVDQGLRLLLEELNFVPGFAFMQDISYLHFLDRVHDGELKLRSAGMWDVPHPWLNIFLPKSRILDFDLGVFKGILKNNKAMGPVLIYPMNKTKWDNEMSAVIPDEEVFYTVGLLRSALEGDLDYLENQNNEILRFCDQEGIVVKQYLPHYTTRGDWMKHFGPKWDKFLKMKMKYDPKALLSPGQKIFTFLEKNRLYG